MMGCSGATRGDEARWHGVVAAQTQLLVFVCMCPSRGSTSAGSAIRPSLASLPLLLSASAAAAARAHVTRTATFITAGQAFKRRSK